MNPVRTIGPLLCLFCVWAAGGPVFAGPCKVGDTVVVVHDTKLKVGDKAVQEVTRGVGLKAQTVSGNWLWVSNQAAGWINQRDVATPTQAIETFTEQIQKNHDDSDAYVRRGLAWFDKQDVDIAIVDLNQAIRLAPRNASAYSNRAILWWAKREVDKAIADCTDAVRLDPQEPMYLANRGILWNMKGEHDQAIAWQEKATDMVTGARGVEFRTRLELYKSRKPLRQASRNAG